MDRHAGESLCVKSILTPGVREGRFAPVLILCGSVSPKAACAEPGRGQGSKGGQARFSSVALIVIGFGFVGEDYEMANWALGRWPVVAPLPAKLLVWAIQGPRLMTPRS